MEVLFRNGGKDSMADYVYELNSIALQCPYKGGNAVYKAGVLLSLLNNTIFFDYLSECASQGIYRRPTHSVKPEQIITLIPNPSDESVAVSINGYGIGICRLQIINITNQVVSEHEFNCGDKDYFLNTSKLSPGIYSVHITIDSNKIVSEKLVIVR